MSLRNKVQSVNICDKHDILRMYCLWRKTFGWLVVARVDVVFGRFVCRGLDYSNKNNTVSVELLLVISVSL